MCADPKNAKDTDDLTVCFALLGSTLVKALSKMLVKLKPGLNFINVLLHWQVPNAQKNSQFRSVAWHFWDLRAQKLYIECW